MRVNATDPDSWRRFRRYFALVGPGSRLVRRSLLRDIERDLGAPEPRPRSRPRGVSGSGLRTRSRVWADGDHGRGGRHAVPAPAARRLDPRQRWEGGPYPGDERIPEPRWGWTHAIEIAAPAEEVWRWVAQIGADRGGFYSYTWLENLVGCGVRDAERIHPEWQARAGDRLVLHPSGPPFEIVEAEPGRHLLAFGAPDEEARGRRAALGRGELAAADRGPRAGAHPAREPLPVGGIGRPAHPPCHGPRPDGADRVRDGPADAARASADAPRAP